MKVIKSENRQGKNYVQVNRLGCFMLMQTFIEFERN